MCHLEGGKSRKFAQLTRQGKCLGLQIVSSKLQNVITWEASSTDSTTIARPPMILKV